MSRTTRTPVDTVDLVKALVVSGVPLNCLMSREELDQIAGQALNTHGGVNGVRAALAEMYGKDQQQVVDCIRAAQRIAAAQDGDAR